MKKKKTWFSKDFRYWFIHYKVATFDIVCWGTFDKHNVSEARPASFTRTESQLPKQYEGQLSHRGDYVKILRQENVSLSKM